MRENVNTKIDVKQNLKNQQKGKYNKQLNIKNNKFGKNNVGRDLKSREKVQMISKDHLICQKNIQKQHQYVQNAQDAYFNADNSSSKNKAKEKKQFKKIIKNNTQKTKSLSSQNKQILFMNQLKNRHNADNKKIIVEPKYIWENSRQPNLIKSKSYKTIKLLNQSQKKYQNASSSSKQRLQRKLINKNRVYNNDLILYTRSQQKLRSSKILTKSQKQSQLNQNTTPRQSQNLSLQYFTPKPKSLYKKRVDKLNLQIQNIKSQNTKSEQVLQKMQKFMNSQELKFKKQKQAYIVHIKRLKQQLQQYRPNIGHIYSFKQYKCQSIIPDQIILDCDEAQPPRNKIRLNNHNKQKRMAQKIMNYYYTQKQQQQTYEDESLVNQMSLSVSSRISAD